MEILTSTSTALIGVAAGYAVLILASKSKGALVPVGYTLGGLVLVGSFLTATACVAKCTNMYQKQCPISETWKTKPAALYETAKPVAGV